MTVGRYSSVCVCQPVGTCSITSPCPQKYLSLLKSPYGLSIRGSGQPIPPVSATTEGRDATMATRPRVLWQRQHEGFAFLGALGSVRAGGNVAGRVGSTRLFRR